MKEINLLIIEDNRLLRDGIKSMIDKQSHIKVEAAPGNGENILKIISAQKPEVILLGLTLPKHKNIELLKSIREIFPEIKIIMMDLVPNHEDVLQFIEAGVSGFILNDATSEEFLRTILSVAEGEKVLPGDMTKPLFSMIVDQGNKLYGASKLIESTRMTRREREVVALIADGLTNKEIADKINLSAYTVKSHVHNILEKMALNTRVQIAIYANSSEDYNKTLESTSSNYK